VLKTTGADGAAPQLVLVGTGSEVSLVLAAAESEGMGGVAAQIVSMPSWELFDAQPIEYKYSVLPAGVPVLAVEALSPEGWCKYAHSVVGMRTFGASAPAKDLCKKFGFTADNVVARAHELLAFFKGKAVPDVLARIDTPGMFFGKHEH